MQLLVLWLAIAGIKREWICEWKKEKSVRWMGRLVFGVGEFGV